MDEKKIKEYYDAFAEKVKALGMKDDPILVKVIAILGMKMGEEDPEEVFDFLANAIEKDEQTVEVMTKTIGSLVRLCMKLKEENKAQKKAIEELNRYIS